MLTNRRTARSVRALGGAAVLALAAVLAAGCGGGSDDDSSSGSKGSSSSKSDEAPAKIRGVDAPTPDDDLTEEMGSDGEKLVAAGCAFGTYKEEAANHVDDGDEISPGTFPPTSGTHYQDWAPFGLYDEPIQDGYAIHNMEHGGVVVWHGTKVDDETVDAIAGLLDDGEKWVVAPRKDILGLFSAAWAKGLTCEPDALAKLGPEATAKALDTWYEVVNSTGSDAEKDVPAYAGAMKEPTPTKDISEESPF